MTDERLVEMYRNGDGEALDLLIQRYRGLVRARSRSFYLAGGDSEDLIQEGMIGLFKAIRDFDTGKGIPFSGFARLCVSRQLATALKLSNRSKHIPLNRYISFNQSIGDEGQHVKDVLTSLGGGPEDIVIDRETLDALTARIDSALSNMEKQVLRHYIRGVSYDEISAKTGYGKKAIDNALQRIKRKLADNG